MNAKPSMIRNGNLKPGFKIDLRIRGLSNALDTGQRVGALLPMTAMMMETMQTLRAGGCEQNNHGGIRTVFCETRRHPHPQVNLTKVFPTLRFGACSQCPESHSPRFAAVIA